MTKKIPKIALLVLTVKIIIDFWKSKDDVYARYAAGESLFERTHQKGK
jgi:hypothetical protein